MSHTVAMEFQPARIPIFVEAIVWAHVTPAPDGDLNPTFESVDLEPYAEELLPDGADVITACTLDHVDHVMSQRADELQQQVDDTVRMLNVTIGAAEHGISDIESTVAALRNIVATLTPSSPRRVEAPAS